MTQQVFCGNNIDLLKQYPDNYFDSIVTDPPYGLGKEPNAEEMLRAWIDSGYLEVKGSGFMGKEWDAFVPQPIFWKEVFRVLKHGGHVLAFYGTRTYDWGVMSMRLAGFEVRDSLQWVYGSGFPKSHNISKAIDKMYGAEREVVGKGNYTMPKADNTMGENSYGISGGKLANGNTAERITADITKPATEEAKEWDGWGSALKPAVEPIVLARKPLEKGLSIAENVLKWGVGGINIDGCRVGFSDDVNFEAKQKTNNLSKVKFFDDERIDLENPIQTYKSQGRFPANLILSCNCENENEHHEDCPIRIMDEQSGESKSQRSERGNIVDNNVYGKYKQQENTLRGHNDKGGASRFFYCAKASKSERNKGLDGFESKQTIGGGGGIGDYIDDVNSASGKYGSEKAPNKNFHPTVKPIKLMQYLVRLITPPNGIVLDPFCGSGTTGVACKLEGFNFVGLELDAEYHKIAEARIKNYVEEKEEIIQADTKSETETNTDTKLVQKSLF